MQVITMSQYAGQSEPGLQAILNASTGLVPTNDRYISVDQSGNVVSQHIADPVGTDDVSPYVQCTLVAHRTAQAGDHYFNGVVVRPAPVKATRSKYKLTTGIRANQLAPQMS